jgi:hypothetical protein
MFHIRLGLTSAIEIKHQHMMNNLSVHKWFPESDTLVQVARVRFSSTIRSPDYNKTRLLQLGFSTSTSEKTHTLMTWKPTSRFKEAVKCGYSHVGQDVPNGHVPNDSKVWVFRVLYFIKSCPTSLHLVNIGKIRHKFI